MTLKCLYFLSSPAENKRISAFEAHNSLAFVCFCNENFVYILLLFTMLSCSFSDTNFSALSAYSSNSLSVRLSYTTTSHFSDNSVHAELLSHNRRTLLPQDKLFRCSQLAHQPFCKIKPVFNIGTARYCFLQSVEIISSILPFVTFEKAPTGIPQSAFNSFGICLSVSNSSIVSV